MMKKICRGVYDTADAELISKYSVGHYGDPHGYEESLYQTRSGSYFVYVNGGAESKHPQEDILRISRDQVSAWLTARG